MSASPQPAQSAKRPLEETSSPSRTDQPEAKRPALDKVIKGESEDKETSPEQSTEEAPASVPPPAAELPAKTNEQHPPSNGTPDDTVGTDEPETKPIASSTTSGSVAQPQSTQSAAASHDETVWIHIRAVISSPEAATIIGKGGENVSKIRSMSGAKCTVSDYQKGAVERILTVSGIVDAVAKVCPSTSPCCGLWAVALTHLPGLRADHSDTEQRAACRAIERALQDIPPAPARSAHTDWLDHW
jgi:heterogeneous nuclear rnp K-like protein 2